MLVCKWLWLYSIFFLYIWWHFYFKNWFVLVFNSLDYQLPHDFGINTIFFWRIKKCCDIAYYRPLLGYKVFFILLTANIQFLFRLVPLKDKCEKKAGAVDTVSDSGHCVVVFVCTCERVCQPSHAPPALHYITIHSVLFLFSGFCPKPKGM